jgi:nucleoside-diphosphate-sugar epimerase
MRILLSGAAGFMGSHLFDYLREQGHYVIGMDNYSIGTYKYIGNDGIIDKIDLVTDRKKVKRAIELYKPEVVYFLSAWAHEGL